MGWDSVERSLSTAELIRDMKRPFTASTGEQYAMTDVVATGGGSHLWGIRTIDGKPAYIVLRLVEHDRGTSWKTMDECTGPFYYDCPLDLLDRVPTPTGGHAAEWRGTVRRFHAREVTACR